MGHHTDAKIRSAAAVVVEELETRRLLSVTLVGRQLQITGDDNPNTIIVRRNVLNPTGQYEVVLDGQVTRWGTGDIDSFRIRSNGGDDNIQIDSTNGAIRITRFIDGGDGNDTILGSFGVDKVNGGLGNDLIVTGNSRDEIEGGGGNDTIAGGNDSDFILGGNGDDSLIGGDGDDTIHGGAGNDSITGGDQNDFLYGNAGDDTILGGRGRDFIHGGAGHDTLDGGAQNDFIYGGAGNDTISGAGGDDVIAGDEESYLPLPGDPQPSVTGNDILSGGIGNDTLLAHTGTDTLTGGAGGDVFDDRGPGHVLTDRDPSETRVSDIVFSGAPAVSRDITLRIFVNGQQVLIPSDAGTLAGGTSVARVTSVNPDGTATVRFSDVINRQFALGEFFQAWGVTFDPAHVGRYIISTTQPLTMTVNGTQTTAFNNHVVQNGQVIEIRYNS
jgi:Ca2+-binding RTX toxin-like protein